MKNTPATEILDFTPFTGQLPIDHGFQGVMFFDEPDQIPAGPGFSEPVYAFQGEQTHPSIPALQLTYRSITARVRQELPNAPIREAAIFDDIPAAPADMCFYPADSHEAKNGNLRNYSAEDNRHQAAHRGLPKLFTHPNTWGVRYAGE